MSYKKEYILGKHSAYLTENMLMLLILLLIVIMTLTGLLKTQTIKREAEELLESHLIAQSLIEYGKASQIDYEKVLMNLHANKVKDQYYFYYDKNWSLLNKTEKCKYISEVTIQNETLMSGTLKKIQVDIYRNELTGKKFIYSLWGKAYY